MQVKDILVQKGGGVFALAPDTGIPEAADMLAQNDVGAAVVSDAGDTIVGILSERDITRAVAKHGGKIADMSVQDLMITDVITCSATSSIPEAMGIMQSNRIRHLPVIATDDSLAGIISIRDLMEICVGDMMGMAV
jgi:CBS domain-containing protein